MEHLIRPRGRFDERELCIFARRQSEYRVHLVGILRHAKSAALIDPYINLQDSWYFDTITICSNVMGQRGDARLQGRIDIHAELGKQKPEALGLADYLTGWEQKLRPLIATDRHRFRVF